jgi:hypothetical protein
MSNGDRSKQHMVTMRVELPGNIGYDVICHTENGQPAIYADTPPAELRAAQLRDACPWQKYRVISFEVL